LVLALVALGSVVLAGTVLDNASQRYQTFVELLSQRATAKAANTHAAAAGVSAADIDFAAATANHVFTAASESESDADADTEADDEEEAEADDTDSGSDSDSGVSLLESNSHSHSHSHSRVRNSRLKESGSMSESDANAGARLSPVDWPQNLVVSPRMTPACRRQLHNYLSDCVFDGKSADANTPNCYQIYAVWARDCFAGGIMPSEKDAE